VEVHMATTMMMTMTTLTDHQTREVEIHPRLATTAMIMILLVHLIDQVEVANMETIMMMIPMDHPTEEVMMTTILVHQIDLVKVVDMEMTMMTLMGHPTDVIFHNVMGI